MSSDKSGFRPDIEGLRGIAILTVVAYHCDLPWITGGFVGVDVFFVLSGYLITRLLVSEIERTGRLNVLQFYARRVRRLLPASVLTLLATLAVGAFLFAPGELEFTARAGRASALYLGNVFFAVNAADYFAPRVELNPLVHMWSLAVEEQFYMFWPLLIASGLLWIQSRRALVVTIAAITACSFGACIWMTAANATSAFYLLPTRAWEFGAGGLFSLALWRPPLPRRVSMLFGWIGLLLLGTSLVLITSESPFPGWLAMAPVLGTCGMLLAGAATPNAGVSALLSAPPLLRLGALSYSWYLWHWPFLVFVQVLVPDVPPFGKVAASLAALAVAILSYQIVENPLRYHPALVQRPTLSLAAGVILTVASFAGAVQALDFSRALSQTPSIRHYAVAAADDGRLPRSRCVTTYGQSTVRRCDFGTATSPTHIVLFGDSHAIHWFNPIQSIAERQRWALTTVLRSGCGAADLDADTPVRDHEHSSCDAWRRAAIESIVSWRPDLVILATATNRMPVDRREWRARVRDGMREALEPLAAAGVHIVVMRDVPRFSFDVPDCLARAARHGWDVRDWCTGGATSSVNADVYGAEQEAARGLKGVRFVDTLSALCDHQVCKTISDGLVMYRDNSHLTGTFADSLQTLIEPHLAAALDEPETPAGHEPTGEEPLASVR